MDTHSRVEQSTTDPEEDPSIDSQREAEAQRNILQLLRIGSRILHHDATRRVNGVGNLCSRQCKEQKEHSADIFAGGSNEVVADLVWDASGEGQAEGVVVVDGRVAMASEGKVEACTNVRTDGREMWKLLPLPPMGSCSKSAFGLRKCSGT